MINGRTDKESLHNPGCSENLRLLIRENRGKAEKGVRDYRPLIQAYWQGWKAGFDNA